MGVEGVAEEGGGGSGASAGKVEEGRMILLLAGIDGRRAHQSVPGFVNAA